MACSVRHLQRFLGFFFFPCAGDAKCKSLRVYRINGWRRSPAGSPRQTVDDRRGGGGAEEVGDWC